jgi:tetratricopeptide (TPR) repeat protein
MVVSYAQTTITIYEQGKSTVVRYKNTQNQYDYTGSAIYQIGRENGTNLINPNSTEDIYRSQHAFSLSSIPSNATITQVSLSWFTSSYSCLSCSLMVVQTDGTGGLGTLWSNIGSGTVLISDLAYSGNTINSNSLKTAVINANRGSLYLGSMSQSEGDNNTGALLELRLNVTYTVPPTTVSFWADNNFTASGGTTHGTMTIGGTSKDIPLRGYSISKNEGENVSLQANSPQTDIDNLQRIWHNGSFEHSTWKKNNQATGNNNQTLSWAVSTGDQDATYQAQLRQVKTTTTGSLSTSENWFTSVTLTGNVTVPAGKTLNITSDATVNLNGYSISSTGGTITVGTQIVSAALSTGSTINTIYPTIQAAVNAAVSGQTINVYGALSLTSNALISTGISFNSNSSVKLNGYSIISTGGTISGSSAVGLRALLKNGTTLKGICGSINTACSYAGTGYTVEVKSGTFSESAGLTNKTDVTVSGNGTANSIINGNVSFSSSQGCTLTNLTVTGNVSLSYGTSDNHLTYLTIQGNIQPNMGSHSDIRYVDLTSSNSAGIMAGYCTSSYNFGSIRNKTAEGIYATGMNLTVAYVTLCCNGPAYPNRLDVTSVGSSPDIYLHDDLFSQSAIGSTVSGSYIHYNSWTYCGTPKVVSIADNTASIKELPSIWDKITESKKSAGKDDYQRIIENRRSIFEKIKNENEGGKIDYSQYAKELTDLISQFRVVIQNCPGSASSLNALQEIIDYYRLLHMNKEAKQLVSNLLKNNLFSELGSQIKILSISLLVDEQDYDGALRLFDEVINEIPNTSEASFLLYNKALLLETYKNDYAGADLVYDRLLKQNPNSIWSSLAVEKLGKPITPKQNDEIKKAEGFGLENYPNPFNPTTTIKYRIPEDGFVTLKIFDALGREIKTFVSEYKSGGEYSVEFNASGLVSGIYISQLRMNDFVQSKKMMLMK